MSNKKLRIFGVALFAIILLTAFSAFAQDENPVSWTLGAAGVKQSLKAGDKFNVELTATIAEGWHLYSTTQAPGGPTTTVISVPAGQSFVLDGRIQAPKPEKAIDPNFNIETEFYLEGVKFTIPVKVAPNATAGKQTLSVKVLFQTCNDTTCMPPTTLKFDLPLTLAGAAKVSGATETQGTPAAIQSDPVGPTSAPVQAVTGTIVPAAAAKTVSGNSKPASQDDASTVDMTKGWINFIGVAIGMGFLSLLTPCVFPMVPITVSYFTKTAGATRKSAVRNAFTYAIGIILTFTALGMVLALVLGAGALNTFAGNPWVNLLISAIFLVFAFNLFGAFEIRIPSGLLNKLDSVSRRQGGSQTIANLLMGFTFTLTSFTCTAPFVGTLLVMAAGGNWIWPFVGMLAFATAFALPFFFLALMPQMMTHLPKAGGWMNSVKVVMGFLEIAAATKFISNMDLVWKWGIFTRPVVLSIWIALGILAALYIMGLFMLSHDTRVESLSATRLTFAMFFLATTFWLLTGLFGKSLGVVEAFLPPANYHPQVAINDGVEGGGTAEKSKEAVFIQNDYEAALKKARSEKKLIFADFTGYTCTNCRHMEANMFPKPEVQALLKDMVLVQLYTDGEGDVFVKQQQLQQEKFGTMALPLYAVMDAEGKVLSKFPGMTNDTDKFLEFIKQGKSQ